MTEQEHPWETVPEQDAVPETSPAENTDTPDTPIAVSNPDAVLPPDEPTEPDGLKPSDLEPAAISAGAAGGGAGTGGVLHHLSGKGRVPRRLYGYDLLGKGNLRQRKAYQPGLFLRLSAALWRQPADAAVSALFRAVHDDPYAGDAALFPAAHGGALLDAPGNALGLSLDLYHSGDLPHDSQRQQKAP